MQKTAILTETLSLTEFFVSVQGESTLIGCPTAFVRLASCNLRCRWCDTTYSFGKGIAYSCDQLLDKIETSGCRYVCITGGEPLLQEEVYPFMTMLCDQGYTVNLETGGSLSTSKVDPRVKVILDIKCPKSGMSHKNHWPNLDLLNPHDEVKFVLADENDYNFAKGIINQYDLETKTQALLFSPVHGVLNPQDLVNWILRDQLPVRLNLQIHKYIWTPTTKGV